MKIKKYQNAGVLPRLKNFGRRVFNTMNSVSQQASENMRDVRTGTLHSDIKDLQEKGKYEEAQNLAKNYLMADASGIMLPAVASEFTTYGLLGGGLRLGAGTATGYLGEKGAGVLGKYADKKLDTKWIEPTSRFIGGFAGFGIGSNLVNRGLRGLAANGITMHMPQETFMKLRSEAFTREANKAKISIDPYIRNQDYINSLNGDPDLLYHTTPNSIAEGRILSQTIKPREITASHTNNRYLVPGKSDVSLTNNGQNVIWLNKNKFYRNRPGPDQLFITIPREKIDLIQTPQLNTIGTDKIDLTQANILQYNPILKGFEKVKFFTPTFSDKGGVAKVNYAGPTTGQYYSDLLLKSPSVSEANGKMMDMLGSDALIYKNYTEDTGRISVAVPRPSQIKLADPITYDDSGKVIPLSKRDNFSNPDIRWDLPKFAGIKIDTSDPQKRQQLISAFKQRYPQFQQTSEKEFITAGNKYWEIGKMPITEDIKLHKELIKKRLDKLSDSWRETYGYYTDPETHWGNMFSGKTILDKVGEKGVSVVIPAERSGQFGGFFNSNGSRAGESFVTADAWRKKPIRFTQLHESISHPTDKLMFNVQSTVSKKTIKDLYQRISQPKDLFPDFAKYFNNDASEYWFESRATNQEMIKRINEIISKKTGKGLREVYNNSKLLEDYVDKKLVTEDSLIDFLDSMDNAYLSDYATLLEKHSGTEEAKIYADRIRNMIKILPAIAGIGIIGKTTNTKKPNSK